MVNAWNVGELDQMVLPPCHYGFQVYTRKLSVIERMEIYFKKHPDWAMIGEHSFFDKHNIPTRAISLMWNQRSVDTGLGWGFNVASYGLLLMILAKQVNMVPDELICNLGDCHIYLNHVDGLREQIQRSAFELPTVTISDRVVKDISDYTLEDFVVSNYQSHPSIKLPLSN
jgi:thymidylate synthase